LFLAFIINLNLALLLIGLFFFSDNAYILDLLFHQIGLAILTSEEMPELWNGSFSYSIFLFARLNDKLFIGSLIFSIISAGHPTLQNLRAFPHYPMV
jgi:hypothetical protein